jgi:hypothetical protein
MSRSERKRVGASVIKYISKQATKKDRSKESKETNKESKQAKK